MNVKNIIVDLHKKIDNMIEDNVFNNKKLYIWGFQKASYISAQYLIKKGFDVVAILDNNKKHWGNLEEYQVTNYTETYKELTVQNPETLKEADDTAVILVFSRAYEEIKKQAEAYGVENDRCIHIYSPEHYLILDDFNGLKEIPVDERKILQYEILKYLKQICERNGIRYFLAAGTLLGAVRHKGYIPWDDDIDVYMPWEDYKRLIKLFKDGKEGNDRYSLKYFGLDDNFSWIYAKIQDNRTVSRGVRFPLVCDIGVNIDIFPMGGIPGDEAKFNELKEIVADFRKDLSSHLNGFTNGCNTKKIENQINSMMSMYKFDDSEYVGFFINGYWKLEKHHYSAYEKPIKLLFEDEYFDAPSGYDEVLSHSYGDYMQYPPNWQTIRYPHTYKAFWK